MLRKAFDKKARLKHVFFPNQLILHGFCFTRFSVSSNTNTLFIGENIRARIKKCFACNDFRALGVCFRIYGKSRWDSLLLTMQFLLKGFYTLFL